MKNWLSILIYILLIAIVGIGFFMPSGLRDALESNIWSIRFIKQAENNLPMSIKIPDPAPANLHAGLLLAHQALKENNLNKAVDYLQPLVEAEDPLALDTYAEVLYLQGNYEASFQVWFDLHNNKSLEWAHQALKQQDLKNYSALAWDYACILEPDIYCQSYRSKSLNANALREAGFLTQAINAYDRIIRQFPEQGDTYLELTQAYLLAGQIDLAEGSFEQALKHNSLGVLVLLSTAKLLEDNQILTSALQVYDQVLLLDPGNVPARQGLDRLSELP